MTDTEKEIGEQAAVIRALIGECRMEIREDGFLSRGFLIDGGRLIFKFPRNGNVRYEPEIRNLEYVNSLGLGVRLQKVLFVGPAGEYLGLRGVTGSPLETLCLSPEQKAAVGRQLGEALRKLHTAGRDDQPVLSLREEYEAWAVRVRSPEVVGFLKTALTEEDGRLLRDAFFRVVPRRLFALGERTVFSHGDLGDGNVLIDASGQAGIIDFNESCRMEEAADFMDIGDDGICEAMLTQYGADAALRRKTALRRAIRPLIVLQPYLRRGNGDELARLTCRLRECPRRIMAAL